MCPGKGISGKVDKEIIKKLEEGYRKVHDSRHCKSLLKKYLTESTFDKLKKLKTKYGSTLWEVIQSGVMDLDSSVGVYAPDPDAYIIFADLFDPIISDYHEGFKKTDNQPEKDFGDLNKFIDLDPRGEFIVSTRVRCARSIETYPFNPSLTEPEYLRMENDVSYTLQTLTGEYKGKYYPLVNMKTTIRKKLAEDHFLFKEEDRLLKAPSTYRFWPIGRGIFHNTDKTFLVWCNEEDHLRIISMQMGGNLGAVYKRLVGGLIGIERKLSFSKSPHLGYLTFSPTNLGTALRASVHIKLPKLTNNLPMMEKIIQEYNLQLRGNREESVKGGIYDISNKRRLGLTEFQAVMDLQVGVIELIKLERSL